MAVKAIEKLNDNTIKKPYTLLNSLIEYLTTAIPYILSFPTQAK